jgi:hypothetical protein
MWYTCTGDPRQLFLCLLGGGHIRSPLHPVRCTAKNLIPATALREHEKPTPHRARIATLTGRESAAESTPESAANRTSITARIGGSSPPESGTGSAPADGKAAPHPGAANTQTHG